jgi:thiamine biosynthesis lipoprotein
MTEKTGPPRLAVRRYQHRAMATVFEVMIADEDSKFSEGAAVAAFEEIDRLEQELSRYLPNSDISRINNLPPDGMASIGFDAFECLRQSKRYWEQTGGAFDITLGALIDCWVGKDKLLLNPSLEDIEAARARCGLDLLELDEAAMSVRVKNRIPFIDLGAIGKGYAVDRAVELLKEWGVDSALVHGGSSSAFAYGDYPDGEGWPVTISNPEDPSKIIEKINLNNQGLGGSGIKKGMHIIDPRAAKPVRGRRAAWVRSDSATKSDAVSTACMIMTHDEIQNYVNEQSELWAMIVDAGVEGIPDTVIKFGRALQV